MWEVSEMVSPTFILSGGHMRIIMVVVYVLISLGFYTTLGTIDPSKQTEAVIRSLLWPLEFGRQIGEKSKEYRNVDGND
ncbi:hypothetical protein EVB97_085 [Rhizobium phage RHph_Y65]|uniref:Transmembrane protein n=1 Tax=Rhizobium phage RHph_Y65 TaxID=2509785 RepID=A0A7S5R7R8_9CAUD|nr:hypothetical protein PQC17_gp085 [Rhizobium phage RHph_Y65]QIG72643.1 hypothetical protein EVB97_085 [Rhizobium phage RHph_Y65]QIG77674.1 hypothetical protein EVB64_087 [Rhizobium phage RHph_TM61]